MSQPAIPLQPLTPPNGDNRPPSGAAPLLTALAASQGPQSLFKPRPANPDPQQDGWATAALETFDVFALIVNKMIGTGVYSSPATVFLLTGNKALTLGLFFVGFLYSVVSMVMYLDYAAAFPYTGGELVYMDEITARAIRYAVDDHPPAAGERAPTPRDKIRGVLRKFLGDGLLAYITYSIVFVANFNSGTNSMQTGRMILLCIAAAEPGTPDVNRDAVRLIGVVVLTAICLLQFFSPAIGRALNKGFAVVKILFLIALFLVAAAANAHPMTTPDGAMVDRAPDWATWHETGSKLYFAKALLAVLFAFEGWENATFVTGEIPRRRQHVLRSGFVLAVTTVGILYVLVVAMFLQSTTWESVKAGKTNVNYAPLLTGNGTAAKRGWAIIAAISSLGSLNSIIYTFSRVKQVIGQAEVLPWSKVWKKDDSICRDPIHKAPQGGLIIHWVMSVVVIAGASSVPSTLESISLPGYIQTYAHCFILMILGGAYLRLNAREEALTNPHAPPADDIDSDEEERRPPFRPTQARTRVARACLTLATALYVATNLAILVINAIPPYGGADGSEVAFKGFGYPAITGCLVLFGAVYYVAVFGSAVRVYPQAEQDGEGPTPPAVREDGLFRPGGWSLLRYAGVRCEIRKDRYYSQRYERVARFGRRWRILYYLPGDDTQQGPDTQTTNTPATQANDPAAAAAQANTTVVTHAGAAAEEVRLAAEAADAAVAQFNALAAQVGADPGEVDAAAARVRDAVTRMNVAVARFNSAVPRGRQEQAAGAWADFLYWFFGGTRLRETPAEKLGTVLDTIRCWP